MSEQDIFKQCQQEQTLEPLITAVTKGLIKFNAMPRGGGMHYFSMRSEEGLIDFEDDIYFYTSIGGKRLDRMIFVNDAPGSDAKGRLERALSRVNWKLRGYDK